jgi:putative hydrolase of the HAD superfamily
MHVLQALNVDIPNSVVREGVDDLMRATLAGSQPVDGVINAVRALSESGVRLGVISNAVYHPFLEWSLAKFGILDCFDVVVTSASAGYYKTRPELYLGTLDRLDAIPERSIHIGDSCRFDVQGARNAGMHAVLYSPELSDVRCVEADIEVSTLVGIVPLLFDHFGGASA